LRIADDACLDERVEVDAPDSDSSADVQRRELPLIDPVPNRLVLTTMSPELTAHRAACFIRARLR
jgi:hypothetical protein